MHRQPARRRRHLAAAFVSSALLGAATLAPLPVGAQPSDPAIAAPDWVEAKPGTTVRPFAQATITGAGTMAGVTVLLLDGLESAVDQVALAGSHPGITAHYNPATGLLRLRGEASVAAYQAALRDVTYQQTTAAEGARSFIVVAGTAIYLPETGNLYEYFQTNDHITWTDARAEALTKTFGPFEGFLATLTSQAENDVAVIELTGNAWFGASDEEAEGVWKWMDGPEAGQIFWQGADNGTAVEGRFNNWAPGEPNDWGTGEHYAHIFGTGADAGLWNDYPDSPQGIEDDVLGYLVEYEGDERIDQVARQVTLRLCDRTIGAEHLDGGIQSAIARLYMSYFLRQPDAAGLAYWVAQADGGLGLQQMSWYFAQSLEFELTYGSLNDAGFVSLVYNNVMCREADGPGAAYWLDLLENNGISREGLMFYFSDSPEFRARSAS